MLKQLENIGLTIAFSLCLLEAKADDNDSVRRFGCSFDVHPGKVISMDKYQKKWQKKTQSVSLNAQINYVSLPKDSDLFDKEYNFPKLSVGFRYSFNDVTMHRSPDEAWGLAEEVGYDSRLGNIASLYASFTRPLFRRRRWSTDYMLATGISFAGTKYNKQDNIDDELIGANWNIYFQLGFHLTYRIARDWGIRAGIDYYHHSNGALYRPNKGANIWGPSAGIEYFPYYDNLIENQTKAASKPFNKYWYVELSAGLGGKTLNEDWQQTQFHTPEGEPDYRTENFRIYPTCSSQANIMFRYSRRWASGLGADLFYGNYASHIEKMDIAAGKDLKHSPFSVGLGARHQVFYHRFSLSMSLGYYLYRHMGDNANQVEKPYYERIGITYTFPKLRHLTVGAFVKAHLTKADYTEFSVSFPVYRHSL